MWRINYYSKVAWNGRWFQVLWKKLQKKGRKVQIFENERVPWGQDVTLQSSRSKIWPSQTFPPFCGMGLLHSRSRFLTLKSPQVALHSDQCPQELHPPSMSLNAYKIKKKTIYIFFVHESVVVILTIIECISSLILALTARVNQNYHPRENHPPKKKKWEIDDCV